jgi:hypothetical protein
MIAMLKRHPLIAVLGALAVVLVAIIAYEAASGSLRSQLAGSGTQGAAPVQPKLLPPIQPVIAEQAYPETTARPLLSPNRRPAPEKTAVGSSSTPKGLYVLTGVTIVGPLRIALLREKSSGRVVRAEKGKEVNGVMVAEIQPESVTLGPAGDQEVISLQVQKAGAAPAAPAPGPFAPPPAPAAPAAPPEVPIAAGQNPAARGPISPGSQGSALTPPPPPGTVPPPTPPPPSTFGPAPAQQSQSAPLTPEELLARRRARRTQQSQ